MTTKQIQGTPDEIGAQFFTQYCMPVVRDAQAQMQATPRQLAQLYFGFISACMGSMAADLGQEQSAHVGQLAVDAFAKTDLGGGDARTH